jgi:hypothetical protein
MSKLSCDHETSSTHLLRRLTRWYKFFTKLPISLEDISVIQMAEGSGTSYEARRDAVGTWAVYRVYQVKYDKTSHAMHETQGSGLSLENALDMLSRNCPDGMARKSGVYNHPVQVAKLIRHDFTAPAV